MTFIRFPLLLLIVLFITSIFNAFVSGRLLDNFLFDKEVKASVCDNYQRPVTNETRNGNNTKMEFMILAHFKCMESNMKHIASNESEVDAPLKMLKECWRDSVKTNYPSTDQEWMDIYCSRETPYILSNIGNHCFIKKYLLREIKRRDDQLPRLENETEIAQRFLDIMRQFNPDDDSDVEDLDVDEDRERRKQLLLDIKKKRDPRRFHRLLQCMEIQPSSVVFNSLSEHFSYKLTGLLPLAHNQSLKSYCKDDKGKEGLRKQIKCLDSITVGAGASNRSQILHNIWKDIVYVSDYPVNNVSLTETVDKFCSDGDASATGNGNIIRFPLTLLHLVEVYTRERIQADMINSTNNATVVSSFDDDTPSTCIPQSLAEKNKEVEFFQQTPDNISSIRQFNEVCIGRNETTLISLMKRNSLACAISNLTASNSRSMHALLKYCWGQQLNFLPGSNVTGDHRNNTVIPSSKKDWFNVYCNYSRLDSERMRLTNMSEGMECIMLLSHLNSRSTFESKGHNVTIPARTKDEDILMKCMMESDYPPADL